MKDERKCMTVAEGVWTDGLLPGDILLFRGKGRLSDLIKVGGRGDYSHVGMFDWSHHGLEMCLESREWIGVRAVTLRSQVDRYDGLIDVYRPQLPEMVRNAAADFMWGFTGRRYGWWALFAAALSHTIIGRFLFRPSTDDDVANGNDRPLYCSQAVALAYNRAGADLVKRLSDRYTEPGDIAKCALLEYKFTLVGEL